MLNSSLCSCEEQIERNILLIISELKCGNLTEPQCSDLALYGNDWEPEFFQVEGLAVLILYIGRVE